MQSWVTADGIYYEGDQVAPEDAAVPARPSQDYAWINGTWTYAATELDYVSEVQALLDRTARQRSYDSILSACSYAGSSIPKFKAEGQACLLWRDAVWAQCYASLAAVQTGQVAAPTVDAFVASLPAITWP